MLFVRALLHYRVWQPNEIYMSRNEENDTQQPNVYVYSDNAQKRSHHVDIN